MSHFVNSVIFISALASCIFAGGAEEFGVNSLISDGERALVTQSRPARASDTTIVAGNYTLSIPASGSIASLQMPQSEYDKWNKGNEGFNNSADRNALSAVLYGLFKDDFDFIFFINNEVSKAADIGYYGQLIQTKNEIDGLGMSQFDYTSATGSAGNLQSVIHLPYLGAIQSGPTLHELAHNWANFMKSFEMASPTGNYPSIPHWGWASTEGQLGGFKLSTLQDLGGGLYQAYNGRPGATYFGGNANGGNGLPYGPWEMYLAGFWPLDSCEDITYFEGVTTDNTLFGEGKFNATARLQYTKTAMIAEQGARVPDVTTSQKSFKILPIVITAAPLTPTEWSDATAQVDWFTFAGADASSLYNFWEATRGIGTVSSSNLHSSLLGTVTPVQVVSKRAQSVVSVQYQSGRLQFSEPVQGYRIIRANGAVVKEVRGRQTESVSVSSDIATGLYVVSVMQGGSWQKGFSFTLH